MKVLSVKLTPPLECLRPAWRHGAASFMRPVPPLFQMSHGEFFTASQSLGRQSRKPYYIWGQAALKLTATAATAKLAQRDRGMFPISTWQQSKLHATWSHLLWCRCWTEHNALKMQEKLDEPLEYANSLNLEWVSLRSCKHVLNRFTYIWWVLWPINQVFKHLLINWIDFFFHLEQI